MEKGKTFLCIPAGMGYSFVNKAVPLTAEVKTYFILFSLVKLRAMGAKIFALGANTFIMKSKN